MAKESATPIIETEDVYKDTEVDGVKKRTLKLKPKSRRGFKDLLNAEGIDDEKIKVIEDTKTRLEDNLAVVLGDRLTAEADDLADVSIKVPLIGGMSLKMSRTHTEQKSNGFEMQDGKMKRDGDGNAIAKPKTTVHANLTASVGYKLSKPRREALAGDYHAQIAASLEK